MGKTIFAGRRVVEISTTGIETSYRKYDVHYYDIRHSDECNMTPVTIEPFVKTNYMMTIGLSSPINLGFEGHIKLPDWASNDILSLI